MNRQIILFASTNKGKFEEFQRLIHLDPRLFDLVSLSDLGYAVPPLEETGNTFAENAALKITHARSHLKTNHKHAIVIADDSGMCITALQGKPGIYSRRWAGHEMTDEEIIAYCLAKLKQCDDRTAEYVTAFAISLPDSLTPLIIQDYTRGTILTSPRRESYVEGLPFRALFFIPELAMMFHEARELPLKNRKNLHIGHENALGKCRDYILMQTI